jgi:glycosyltransferase A (GT-A) superfamily protein (DUF2064 family)
MVEDLLRRIHNADAEVIIGFDPPGQKNDFRKWLGEGFGYIPQSRSDLGERQADLIEEGISRGFSKIIVMISDSPDIPEKFVNTAVKKLDEYSCVLGPCQDGGYYLLGFRSERYLRQLLLDIEWSREDVSKILRSRMALNGLDCLMLDPWRDIDTIQDLEEYYYRACQRDSRGKTVSLIEEAGFFNE